MTDASTSSLSRAGDHGAETDDLHTLRMVVKDIPRAIGETIKANGMTWNSRPGSQHEREVSEQGPFVGRSKSPVDDAYSIALARHMSAIQHFEDLARLLEPPTTAYGPASLTRTALENSAWAWWALDPSLDVKHRIARGLSHTIASLNEVIRFPSANLQAQAEAKRDVIAADAGAHGFYVERSGKDGSPLWVEEKPPTITSLLELQLGEGGRSVYRDLSAVAHGMLFGIMNRIEDVGVPIDRPGVKLVKPGLSLPFLVYSTTVALDSFFEATDRRFLLYGWDAGYWNGWKREAKRFMIRVIKRRPAQQT